MKKLLMILLSTNIIVGMEQPDTIQEPVIVNYDDGAQLPPEVTSGVIFGATPRLSRFCEFTELVAHDIHEILQSKPKGMRQDLKKLKADKSETLRTMEQHFTKKRYSDTALRCFFEHGFDRKKLSKNMHTLVKIAEGCENGSQLIHVFLPIYFEEHLVKDMPAEDEKSLLKRFLTASAHFYKQLYQEQKPAQRVHIIVPPLEDFKEKVTTKDIAEISPKLSELIAAVFKKRLFDQGVKKVTLLNQNKIELEGLGKRLAENYSPKDVTLQPFKIYVGCNETLIFTPYTIPSEKIPSPLLSCVVSPALVETFEQAEK